MGAITIRKLDDQVIEQLKNKARANHRSMEEEARAILTAASLTPQPLRGEAAVEYFRRHLRETFGDRIVEGGQQALRESRYGVEEDDEGFDPQ